MFLVSISREFLSIHLIFAPKPSNISHDNLISTILGTLLITQTPSINNVAGSIATAEFFAPLIFTSPFKGVGPVITNFSIIAP